MKKKLFALLAACMMLAMVFSLAACGEPAPAPGGGDDAPVVDDAAPVEDDAAPAGDVDLSNVAVEIAYGDFDGMSDLGSKIQNFELDDAVVSIDGEIEKLGSTFSIGERNADGTERVGFSIEVTGWEEADYPADGTHVQLTGVVTADGLAHAIVVAPENFVIVADEAPADEAPVEAPAEAPAE